MDAAAAPDTMPMPARARHKPAAVQTPHAHRRSAPRHFLPGESTDRRHPQRELPPKLRSERREP
ncbi:hypothetical protein DEO45_03270 [Rhodanobacter denitrificans]|uniref:Uncharacterized protein n=1 Tax=Rhodanobacter denitrificans TaxID=666685 RepID=A0A368KFX1_9GAMM|nr:hypothetical protein DEO45_03270 [Rhodanobacter denitrificans]